MEQKKKKQTQKTKKENQERLPRQAVEVSYLDHLNPGLAQLGAQRDPIRMTFPHEEKGDQKDPSSCCRRPKAFTTGDSGSVCRCCPS